MKRLLTMCLLVAFPVFLLARGGGGFSSSSSRSSFSSSSRSSGYSSSSSRSYSSGSYSSSRSSGSGGYSSSKSSSSSSGGYKSSSTKSSSSKPSSDTKVSRTTKSDTKAKTDSKPKSDTKKSETKVTKTTVTKKVVVSRVVYRNAPTSHIYITRSYYTPYRISSDFGVGYYHPWTNWLLYSYIMNHSNYNNNWSDYDRQVYYDTAYRNYVLREFRRSHPDYSVRIYRFRVGTRATTFVYDNQEYTVTNMNDQLIFRITCPDVQARDSSFWH